MAHSSALREHGAGGAILVGYFQDVDVTVFDDRPALNWTPPPTAAPQQSEAGYCRYCGPLEAYEVASHDNLCEATRTMKAWESWPGIPGVCDPPGLERWRIEPPEERAPWRVRLTLWWMHTRIWWKAGRWRPGTFKEARRALAAG
jgi:hypothetical protein